MCAFNSLSPTLDACMHGHPPALLGALGQPAASGSGANQERGSLLEVLERRECVKVVPCAGEAALKFIRGRGSCLNTDQRTGAVRQHHAGRKKTKKKCPHRCPCRHVYPRELPLYRYWWKAPAIRREESWKWKSGRKHRAWDVVTQGCCVSDVVPEPW